MIKAMRVSAHDKTRTVGMDQMMEDKTLKDTIYRQNLVPQLENWRLHYKIGV